MFTWLSGFRTKNQLRKGFSRKNRVVESFVAPPSFLLYLWACFPLLLIATFETPAIIAGIIATFINFILIHMDTFQFIRYLMSGFVLLVVFLLYHLDVFNELSALFYKNA